MSMVDPLSGLENDIFGSLRGGWEADGDSDSWEVVVWTVDQERGAVVAQNV